MGGAALGEPLIVGLRFAEGDGAAATRGHAYLSTYRPDGSTLGAVLPEADAEYNLYRDAEAVSNTYPAATRPAPSAVFELLRFGRIVGPDALTPDTVPHWRKVRTPTGTGWVNLNAEGVFKYSDADFPQWKRWQLISETAGAQTADQNSRCDAQSLLAALDSDHDGTVSRAEAEQMLSTPEVQASLKRTICKLPSEWDAAAIEQRWDWLRTASPCNPDPLSEDDFNTRFKPHLEALAFPMPAGADWRFEPREFIKVFRRCGWLSSREFVRCLPLRYRTEERQRGSRVIIVNISTATARARVEDRNSVAFFQVCRKYGISGRHRLAHFLSQVFRETGVLRWPEELASGEDYEGRADLGNVQVGDGRRFKGRGLIQTTGRSNYARYSRYRGRTGRDAYTVEPNNRLLSEDAFVAADTAGLYWSSRNVGDGLLGINRVADRGLSEADLRSATRNVNGAADGPWTGLLERRSHLKVLSSILLDSISPLDPEKERRDV